MGLDSKALDVPAQFTKNRKFAEPVALDRQTHRLRPAILGGRGWTLMVTERSF
ncbi:hypothetical protein ACFL2C_04290 [Patescibacteria group bacterium]